METNYRSVLIIQLSLLLYFACPSAFAQKEVLLSFGPDSGPKLCFRFDSEGQDQVVYIPELGSDKSEEVLYKGSIQALPLELEAAKDLPKGKLIPLSKNMELFKRIFPSTGFVADVTVLINGKQITITRKGKISGEWNSASNLRTELLDPSAPERGTLNLLEDGRVVTAQMKGTGNTDTIPTAPKGGTAETTIAPNPKVDRVVIRDGDVWWKTDAGILAKIPVDKTFAKEFKVREVPYGVGSSREYYFLNLFDPEKSPDDPNSGQTFVVRREDGRSIDIRRSRIPHPLEISVDYGILILGGIRTLSMYNFDEEAKAATNSSSHGNDSRVVIREGRAWWKTDLGKLVEIPVGSERAKNHTIVEVPYGNGSYYLVNFFDPNKNSRQDRTSGETYVVRGHDGLSVRTDYKFNPLSMGMHSVKDGILSVQGSHRKIDLDRFEIEATFQARISNPVTEPNKNVQEVEVDPFEKVGTYFPDVGEKLSAMPRSRFSEVDPRVQREVLSALVSKEIGSAVLLGEPGRGKTTQMEALARKILDGETALPRTWSIRVGTRGSIMAGATLVGIMEERINILLEYCKVVPCILIADELHSWKGGGTSLYSSQDYIQLLKGAMADGSLRIIGMDTNEEYYQAFGNDRAFQRRMPPVEMPPPKNQEILNIYRSWIKRYGYPELSDTSLERIHRLTEKWDPTGGQPAKGTLFLQRLFAKQVIDGKSKLVPTDDDITSAAQELYGYDPAMDDVTLLDRKLESLEQFMNNEVIGHSKVKLELLKHAEMGYTNSSVQERPRMMILLYGPSGTGKSHLGESFARGLGKMPHFVEMTHFGFGADPRDFLRSIHRILTTDSQPVIILDEFEKASPEVKNAVLKLFQDGISSVEQNGSRIQFSARNASFILTSNATGHLVKAAEQNEKGTFGFRQSKGGERSLDPDTVWEQLQQEGISEPILTRLDGIFPVGHSTPEEFKKIVALKVKHALREQGDLKRIAFSFPDQSEFIESIVTEKSVNNREADRIVQEKIRSAIASAARKGKLVDAREVELRILEGKLCVNVLKKLVKE